ncbi:MAG: TIGR02147 family protein [Chitinispirillaceae bacterium]|nr:TIGR02147 family protein [Chitinispirillaceae bacterium]
MAPRKEISAPSVFHYTDYRKFLRDSFQIRDGRGKKRSYRVLCDNVGVKSTGHLTLILQGKANISIPLALKFAGYLHLKKREKEYFQALVLFNQAKTHAEKRDHFLALMSFKESSVRIVDAHQYAYYDKWHHAALRALLEILPVKDDFDEIARMVDPPISPKEAQKSIELMVWLNLVEKNSDGYYKPVDAVIDAGPAIGSLAVTNYALTMLEFGKQAIERFPLDERIYSWVTLGVSEKGYEQVVQELREFRRKLYDIAKNDRASRVYQIQIQAFPLSKSCNREGAL